MNERLAYIKGKMSKREASVHYAWYNPKTDYMLDTEDATEDVLWMIAEIENLRIQVNDLQSPRVSQYTSEQLRQKLASERKQEKAAKEGRRRRPAGLDRSS
jgi:hypothetical protein